jgi:hypothetical protein
LAYDFREYGQCKRLSQEHIRLYGSRKSEMDKASCLLNIANLALCSNDYDDALSICKQSLLLMIKHEVLWRYSVGEQI